MSQPNDNSQGQQVWKPSVGAAFTPAKVNAESFGGIVGAIQDQIASQGAVVKAYPYSFAGIISALQDLTLAVESPPGSEIGPSPGGGDVVVGPDGTPTFDYTTIPINGTLWFDTRQGRLFIAFEGEWYQTNGADGLAVVTEADAAPAASNLALGQFWYDKANNLLYIFDGRYTEPDGTIVPIPTATTSPLWVQLVDASLISTTANLLLAGNQINPTATTAVIDSNYLPYVDPTTLIHQDDLNIYYMESFIALDKVLGQQAIPTSGSPPANPIAGQLWYDNEDLELSIWYVEPGEPDANGQWVPTFSAVMQDQDISALKVGLLAETNARKLSDSNLIANLETVRETILSNKGFLQNEIDGVDAKIAAIPSVDLTNYVTYAQQQADVNPLQASIAGLLGDVGSIYSNFADKNDLSREVTILNSSINAKASSVELSAVQATIPSIAGYATETYVTTAIAALPAGITAVGGTVTGKLTLDKADAAIPSIDFSTHSYDGKLAQKYKSNCPTDKYATFGTNDNLFEYSWNFTDCEDFCYTHSTNGKVASIDKNGIAAKNLYVSDFGSNTTYGRALLNTIDVGARLTSYQTALTSLRTNAATATTLDELKTAIANALANV